MSKRNSQILKNQYGVDTKRLPRQIIAELDVDESKHTKGFPKARDYLDNPIVSEDLRQI